MLKISNFERYFYSCPEVDCCDIEHYPEVSEDVFHMMEMEFIEDTSVVHLFPFVTVDGVDNPFIDIYIWDVMLYPRVYQRFIICEGWRLSNEAEDCLQKYIDSDLLHVDNRLFENMKEEITKHFPMWNYNNYSVQDRKIAFEHMYYASHHSGVKEILFKAGLNNIASRIYEIPSHNLIGTSPSSIVGHDLPIKLLRILNQPGFDEKLCTDEWMERCRSIYKQYSGYIGEKMPSLSQWIYLDNLYENGGVFAGERFIRSLYEKLSSCWSEDIFKDYESFFLLRKEFLDMRKMKIPKPDEVGGIVDKLKRVQHYKREKAYVDKMINGRRDISSFEYRGDSYSVIMPVSVLDLCKEAISQGNCLLDYVEDHASGETTILFVRRNSEQNRSFVTIEVKDRVVKQAYARFNELPSKEVFEFLLEYAKRNGFICNQYKLIMESIDYCDDEVDDYLSELE